ncbi:hypothetical protein CRUP_015541 [Coryphaenoides rupestris]|nr:hypothetical protein CRUP_015541 [Coryphaenoides rupestris]
MPVIPSLQMVQQAGVSHGNPPGSGLSYLEHICQLIEKIAQLQETNLRLQRQVCGLQKTGRVAKTRETCSVPPQDHSGSGPCSCPLAPAGASLSVRPTAPPPRPPEDPSKAGRHPRGGPPLNGLKKSTGEGSTLVHV